MTQSQMKELVSVCMDMLHEEYGWTFKRGVKSHTLRLLKINAPYGQETLLQALEASLREYRAA